MKYPTLIDWFNFVVFGLGPALLGLWFLRKFKP